VQNNKVFIFIAVLHLGETGSLTKLNYKEYLKYLYVSLALRCSPPVLKNVVLIAGLVDPMIMR
jgi:hypothetical protein